MAISFFVQPLVALQKQHLENFSQNLNLSTHAAPWFLYSTIGIDYSDSQTAYDASFNEQGSLLVQRDALGRETKYTYDKLGRRIQRELPQGQIETNTYDLLGRMTDRTDFNGMKTTYEFDIMNRVTAINADPSHPSLVYTHTPKRFEFTYDVLGRRDSATVFVKVRILIESDDRIVIG